MIGSRYSPGENDLTHRRFQDLALALIAFELGWVDAGAATGSLAGCLALAPIHERGTPETGDPPRDCANSRSYDAGAPCGLILPESVSSLWDGCIANAEVEIFPEVIDLIRGGGRTRAYDLRIMSASPPAENKANQQLSSEESGKTRQNSHPGRNRKTERWSYLWVRCLHYFPQRDFGESGVALLRVGR